MLSSIPRANYTSKKLPENIPCVRLVSCYRLPMNELLDPQNESHVLAHVTPAELLDERPTLADLHPAPAGHGSPADRGSADAYYGRGCSPHYISAGRVRVTPLDGMTPAQVAEYRAAYEGEDDRKRWD